MMARKKQNRKKQNRKKTKLLTVENERKFVLSSLTMLGFTSIFGCIVLLSWVAAEIADPATLPIREVKVEGDFKYLQTKTLEKLVVSEVDGGFFTVDVDQIRDSVLKAPWVRQVTVRKLWPDTLYLKIREQKAVVRWGDTGFLNEAGELFEPENVARPHGLIRLEGPRGTERQVYRKYQYLVGLLSKHKRQVIGVKLNERRGWSFEIDDGPRVILGKKEVDTRIKRYVREVEKNFGHEVNAMVQLDLRYTNGFTIRRKAEPEDAVEILTEMTRTLNGELNDKLSDENQARGT